MKAFLVKLWAGFIDRVFVNWKPTLISFALAAGIYVVDAFTDYLQALPQGWAKIAALIVLAIGSFLKERAKKQSAPALVPPAP